MPCSIWARRATVALVALLSAGAARAQSRVYTLDADFDTGTLDDVVHNPSDRLLLGPTAVSKTRLVWVDNTAPGAGSPGWIVRIDSTTGRQTSRFDCVALNINGQPTGAPATGNNPGRVAVDTNGDVWIVNRAYYEGNKQGTLSKFSGDVAHCIDRNNNGQIETSRDADNDGIVDPYKDPGSVPPDQVEYYGQEDECILATIPLGVVGDIPRAVAVDKRGKIWAGTWTGNTVYRFNPNEPVALEASRVFRISQGFAFNASFYSAATADDYIYFASNPNWAASGVGRVVRIDINDLNQADYVTCGGGGGGSVYGIVAVPGTHKAWAGAYNGTGIWKIDFDANPATCTWVSVPSQVTAVTLDRNGKVWAAGYSSGSVYRLDQNGTIEATCPTNGGAPHGLSVDFDGYIWSVQDSPWHLVRFSPTVTANNCGRTGPYPIDRGPLGPGAYNYGPYLYSDFTGVQIDRQAPYTYVGSWDATYDGGAANIPWATVRWNLEPEGAEPAETSLLVRVRAANSLASLGQAAYALAGNGTPLSGVSGRYVQVSAGLNGPGFVTPVLSDIVVEGPCNPLNDGCCVKDADCDDGNICSLDSCPVPGGACSHAPAMGCCLVDGDCDDGQLCTTDSCPVPGGACLNAPVPGCCNSNLDCADGDLCTADICSGPGGSCSHPLINGCCNTDQDCTLGNLCSGATCPVPGGFCVGSMIPGCCNADGDCADVDLCTLDVCDLPTNTCANAPVPACCNTDAECDDANVCTSDTCSGLGGICSHELTPGCCQPDDPSIGDPCDVPVAPFDQPPCQAGQIQCLNGQLTCEGAVWPQIEICNHVDDDCDGVPDSPNPCPVGTLCIDGVCAGPCEGELNACPSGAQCIDGICLPTDCEEVVCPVGEVCVGGLCGAGGVGGGSEGGQGGGTSVGGQGGTSTEPGSGGSGASADSYGLPSGGGGCLCSAPASSTGRGDLTLLALALALLRRRGSRRRHAGADR